MEITNKMYTLLILIMLVLKLINVDAVSFDEKLCDGDAAVKLYYVVPENFTRVVACQQIECHTLAYYMNYSIGSTALYFRSNETYIFWSGIHHPLENVTVIISNVTNLNLTVFGDRTHATIDCKNKQVGFLFKYSTNISLQRLIFLSCVRTKNDDHFSPALLSFIKGFGLIIHKVQLWESVSGSIFINNTLGIVELREVTVTNTNTANEELTYAGSTIIYYKDCYKQTPHLIIKDSMFVNNSNIPESLAVCRGNRPFPKVEPFAGGLTIYLECESVDVDISNLTMRSNSGGNGGSLAIYLSRTTKGSVIILGSHFESSCSIVGSGLYVDTYEPDEVHSEQPNCQDSLLQLQVINSTFVNNEAQYAGSGLYIKHRLLDHICGTKQVNLTNCKFLNNSVIKPGFGGIALHSINFMMTNYLTHTVPQLLLQIDSCEFTQNHISKTNTPSGGTGVVFTKSNTYLRLVNTRIYHNACSGILAVSSNLIFAGEFYITNNNASSGGGLLLCEDAVMYLEEFVDVTIADNFAEHTGGGITVESECQQSRPMCFYQLGNNALEHPSMINTIKVNLLNNTAKYAGDNLFGGSVEYCYMVPGPNVTSYRNIFKSIFTISNSTPSSVSSPAEHVCLCQNSKHNCNIPINSTLRNLKVFPGENFTIELALVGQLNGLVRGAVKAQLITRQQKRLYQLSNELQKIGNTSCEHVHYTIYSKQSSMTLELGVQHNGDISGFEQFYLFKALSVSITMKKCPIGFTLRNYTNGYTYGLHCDCIDLFRSSSHRSGSITCDIKRKTIKKENSNVWIGLINITGTAYIALHPNCPFDYCNRSLYIVVYETIHTLDQDSQCSNHRTGIMCGACSEGYSLMLGGTKCFRCSNYWLLLCILFVAVGIALIFLLTLLNCTISAGTLSGVVFYCNIIKSNMKSFFPDKNFTFLTPLLKAFVSLINLESVKATCLYDGMDAYWHTWIHFVFPLYLLAVAGAFVCLANRVSWIVRGNAVNVLACLVLLSYTKLLYISIEAVHITYLYLEDGTYEARWYHDGNIRYFTGKHIPLVLVATLVGLILLPFTFCLLFIQCLQKSSHRSIFKCVHRLKPFFDAYTGPFTSKARFWTGLLLLARAVIYIISTINIDSYPNSYLNTGVISLAVLLLFFVALTLPQGLYRLHCLNILEYWLLFNLGCLSMVITLSRMIHHNERATDVAVFCSHFWIGVAFLTFAGIVLYHTCKIIPVKKYLRHMWICLIQKWISNSESTKDVRCHINEAKHPELVSLFDEEREPLVNHSLYECA